MDNVMKIDGTPFAAKVAPKVTMTLEEALQADAPYFDELVDGPVGMLQNALFDMDMDEEANMIEQILWKLVEATIIKQYRSK
jgi:hypothetical protein